MYTYNTSQGFLNPPARNPRSFFPGRKGKRFKIFSRELKTFPPPLSASLCIVPLSPIISSRRIYLDSLPDLVCAGRKTRSRSNLGEKVGPSVKEPPVKEERERKKTGYFVSWFGEQDYL